MQRTKPSPAVPNALPGTTAWQLVNLATNREIEGYASLTSVNKGGQISLFVSSTDANYTIDVYRMGWYNGNGGREVLGPIQRSGGVQAIPPPDPTWPGSANPRRTDR